MVCTIAFGIGIDIPNIRSVVLWGLPNSLLDLLQLIGRGGRGGRPSFAVCYAYHRSLNCSSCPRIEWKCANADKMATARIVTTDECVHFAILHFDLQTSAEFINSKKKSVCTMNLCDFICVCDSCICCPVCAKQCTCSRRMIDNYLEEL